MKISIIKHDYNHTKNKSSDVIVNLGINVLFNSITDTTCTAKINDALNEFSGSIK